MIEYLETCQPEYFRGHHLPVLQVPLWRGITYGELKDALHQKPFYDLGLDVSNEEFHNAVDIFFSDIDQSLPVCYSDEEPTVFFIFTKRETL